jgi:hypothetical protein
VPGGVWAIASVQPSRLERRDAPSSSATPVEFDVPALQDGLQMVGDQRRGREIDLPRGRDGHGVPMTTDGDGELG